MPRPFGGSYQRHTSIETFLRTDRTWAMSNREIEDQPMNDSTVIAAIIAAVVALAVGILGSIFSIVNQILTHRLTQRREIQKYFDEVYKELFAPVISDVFLYIDMATQSF